MKRLLLSICLLFATLPNISAQEIANALVIRLLSGETATYLLQEKPHIRFTATDLVITWGEYEASYPVADLERYYFKHIEQTGLDNLSEELLSLHQAENELIVTGMKQDGVVNVYTPSGVMIATAKESNDGDAVIQMENFADGVYIVKYGNKTTKIKKL